MVRRILWILGLGLISISALAAAIHFVKASANIDSSGNLIVSWKEAGLGLNQSISYLATANVTATWGCVNGGKKHPKASNKEAFSSPVTAEGTFESGRNGQITQSLTLSPDEPAPSDFSCPAGQSVELVAVTYTDVSLEDTTNSILAPLTGTCAGSNGCTDTLYR